jgi:hypothetical protein
MRKKSQSFDKLYRIVDATIEAWLDKFLTEDDKGRAFERDPAHAKALIRFNPRNYYLGDDYILGIKFDGIIAGGSAEGVIGEPVDGIQDKLALLKSKGVKIIVYGWRSNECSFGNPEPRKAAEKYLKAHNIPYDFFYDGKGPMIVDGVLSKRILGSQLGDSELEAILSKANDPNHPYLAERNVSASS